MGLAKVDFKINLFLGPSLAFARGPPNSCHGGEGRLALLVQFESCSKPKRSRAGKKRVSLSSSTPLCPSIQAFFAQAFRPCGQLRVFALYSIWALELPNHAVKFVDPCTSDTVLRPERP